MADEDTPYRLDRSMAEAKLALGVPNAKREIEKLGRTAQPTVQLDDVSHLAPVSFVPRYGAYLQENPGVGYSTIQIQATQTPYLIEHVDAISQTIELLTSLPWQAYGAAPTYEGFFAPAESIAPRTLTFEAGNEAAQSAGMLIQAAVTYPLGLFVAPGTVVTIQTTNPAVLLEVSFVIQEFPAGAS